MATEAGGTPPASSTAVSGTVSNPLTSTASLETRLEALERVLSAEHSHSSTTTGWTPPGTNAALPNMYSLAYCKATPLPGTLYQLNDPHHCNYAYCHSPAGFMATSLTTTPTALPPLLLPSPSQLSPSHQAPCSAHCYTH